MTVQNNPKNQPKAETLEQLVGYWRNSLEKLQDEEDTTVAGYIAADIINTRFWEDEWMGSEEADSDILEVHDLAVALEIPGEIIYFPKDNTIINREQACSRIKGQIDRLKERYTQKKQAD